MKGKTETQLIFIFGVVTVLWGVISGNYFGVGPYDMINHGGIWKPIGEILKPLAFLVTATQENGVWKKTTLLYPGEYEYKFMVDGRWCTDPRDRRDRSGVHDRLATTQGPAAREIA